MADITPYSYLKARRGEQCSTKLTEAQAREIRRRRQVAAELLAEARTLSNPALGEKFGRHHKAIGRIINGGRWAKNSRKAYQGLSFADVQIIRQAARERDRLKSLAALHSYKALAREFGVAENTIYCICSGRNWIYLEAAA